MELLDSIKQVELWGNSGYDYVVAILIFIGSIAILKIFQVIILARLNNLAKKTKTDLDDMLIEVFRSIKPPFYFFISVYLAIKTITVADIVTKILLALFLIALVFEIVQAISRILDYMMKKYFSRNREEGGDNQHSQSMINLLQVIVKIILWALGFVLILSNLGNQFVGMTNNKETADRISSVFGKIKKLKTSYSTSESSLSQNNSLQEEFVIQSRDVAGQDIGHFTGKIAGGKPPFFSVQFPYFDKEKMYRKFQPKIPNFSLTVNTGDENMDKHIFQNQVEANFVRINQEITNLINSYLAKP